MNRRVPGLLLAVLACSAAGAQAQALQKGSITGRVSDASGGVLPGVKVTLTGPVLIAAHTDTTNSQGVYRFPALDAGLYALTFEVAGFRKLSRTGVVVSLATTVTVDAALEVGDIAETVEVSGTGAPIDVTDTNVATNLDYRALQDLPTARDVWAILQSMAPQVILDREDVGGSEGGLQAVFSTHGASWHQNTYAFNGADVTDPAATGASQFYFDYDSFEQVNISTAQHSAEVGTPGVYYNLVARRGTDSFHGGLAYYFENDGLVADNISDELRDQGITGGTKVNLFSDATGQLGGPIVKDKLRFFASVRDWRIHRDVLDFPISENTDLFSWLVNASWQINPNNRFDALVTRQTYYKPNRNASAQVPPESTWVEDDVFRIYQGHYTSQISDNALVDARVSYVNIDFPLRDQPGSTRANITEATTGIQAGAAQLNFDQFRSRLAIDGTLSYFKGRWFGASHNLKVGYSFYRGYTEETDGAFDSVNLTTFGGAPSTVLQWNTPVFVKNEFTGSVLFAQDSISSGRWAFDLGLRFEHTTGTLPTQASPAGRFVDARSFPEQEVISWNDLAPRVGIVYDLLGDHRSAIKAGYSRYYHAISTGMINTPNQNGLGGQGFLWNDLDGDRNFQDGEAGDLLFAFGGSITSVDPDLKRPRTDEFTLGAEFELPHDVKLSVMGIYRKGTNFIAVTEVGIPQDTTGYDPTVGIDPGDDGQAGTADDQPVSTFNLKPEFVGLNRLFETNPDGFESEYKGVEITFQKRFADDWQGLLTYALSRADLSSTAITISQFGGEEEGAGGIGFSLSGATAFNDPNGRINNTEGPNFYDRTHLLKLNLSYDIRKWGMNVAGVYKLQTGTPFGRIVSLAADANGVAYNQGPITFFAEPRDERRFPTLHLVDFRLSKYFDFAVRHRIELIADVFNLFNSNTETSINVNTGVALGDPISILGPRVLRLGARWRF